MISRLIIVALLLSLVFGGSIRLESTTAATGR